MGSWRDDCADMLGKQEEIRRLHAVCRTYREENEQLQQEKDYWMKRCVNACREERHPVFINTEKECFLIDTDAEEADVERWMVNERLREISLIEYLRSCQYFVEVIWDSRSETYQQSVLAMNYRNNHMIQGLEESE